MSPNSIRNFFNSLLLLIGENLYHIRAVVLLRSIPFHNNKLGFYNLTSLILSISYSVYRFDLKSIQPSSIFFISIIENIFEYCFLIWNLLRPYYSARLGFLTLLSYYNAEPSLASVFSYLACPLSFEENIE